jgi:hypothetical protein
MPSKSAVERANEQWGHGQLVDAAGNPMRAQNPSYIDKANVGFAGGGSGGENPMIDIVGLKKNVALLNWAAGALFVGGISGFLILDDRISDRIKPVSEGVVELKVQNAKLSSGIDEILRRMDREDDEPQRSSGEGKASPVREGAGDSGR